MTTMHYHSAIYKINSSKLLATRICFEEYNCDILPTELSIRELATLLSKMQKTCFKDANLGNSNTKRLVELFTAQHDKTVIVSISLGFLSHTTNYMDFVDAGAATVQKSTLDMLPYQQPWINEVCRAKMRELSGKSPVSIVMNMIEKYVVTYLMKTSKKVDGLYLYVEKNPDHGSPGFLMNYYKRYGFSIMNIQDNEYYYMQKSLK
jgi:hypothetical protein|uniref:N-acetyltransferase domain-containing protein n=1 Tax=viral metagenome TaxID=1070528 RepID=A0A6C0IQH1_9ZZZZ